MTKDEISDMYLSFLSDEGFRPKVDEDGEIVFKAEGTEYAIEISEDDVLYFRIYSFIGATDGNEQKQNAIYAANESSSKIKVAKVVLVENLVMASVELFLNAPDQFKAVFDRVIVALQISIETFYEMLDEITNDLTNESNAEIRGDSNDDYEDVQMEEPERWQLKDQFYQSDIANTVHLLAVEANRFDELQRHDQATITKKKWLERLSEHAQEWISIFGSSDGYYDVRFQLARFVEPLLKAYVVMRNRDGMGDVLECLRQLHEILDDQQIDMEIFENKINRYIADIPVFERIISFVNENPNVAQKSIYKSLSIDGKEAAYMLEWADKLKIISRMRYKDTWLLKLTNFPAVTV